MPDTKISNETPAGPLLGPEILLLLQGGLNRQSTAQAVANLGGGSVALVATLTAAGSPSLAWTGLTGDDYLLIMRALQPTTNAVDILLQFGTGSGPTWITAATYQSFSQYWVETTGATGAQGSSNSPGIQLANAVDNAGGGLIGGELKMFGLSQAIRHAVNFTTNRLNGGVVANLRGAGTAAGTTPKTAVRLIPSAGNLASGSASLYRIVP